MTALRTTAATLTTTVLTTADSELREIADEIWMRSPTTGGAWTRVPVDALAAVAMYVRDVAA